MNLILSVSYINLSSISQAQTSARLDPNNTYLPIYDNLPRKTSPTSTVNTSDVMYFFMICLPYFLIQFLWKLFFLEFGNGSQFKQLPQYFSFWINKLNFCCGNYSREETIQGQKLYEEMRYVELVLSQVAYISSSFTQGNLIDFPGLHTNNIMISLFRDILEFVGFVLLDFICFLCCFQM